MMIEGRAYSLDEEWWETDFNTILDRLISKKNGGDLIGAKYFEGDYIPVPTEKLFDIDMILYTIAESACDEMGEWAEDYPSEDYPSLTDEEKTEFKELIVSFLDKKDPHNFFRVENICKKTITEEDLDRCNEMNILELLKPQEES